MKKILTGLTLAMAVSSVNAAEVSGTISFTNDYRFRGVSQTAGDAAVQGSLDVEFENGVYAGIWGSNVDFDDDANLEIDYYVGYWGEINDDWSYDISLNYYTYPGYDAADGDYAEIIAGLYYGDLGLTYAYADDNFNAGESAHYLAIDYSYALTEAVSLDLHAGRSFGDYWGNEDIGDLDDYTDYSVGISGSYAGLDLSAAYLFTDLDGDDEVDSGAFRNDNTLLLSVSRTF
ncbi:TorF family putative porin [Neptuniibacter halophilus]|uniref:TorF family putative porin n=1 Tax=Neptuniibacter halophilus TaxID=651666 RepID=UPI002573EC50|nr:TorF family putative porin [Neptuniibacter halophilus]